MDQMYFIMVQNHSLGVRLCKLSWIVGRVGVTFPQVAVSNVSFVPSCGSLQDFPPQHNTGALMVTMKLPPGNPGIIPYKVGRDLLSVL